MSNVIQPRSYSARQAAWVQQRPSALIDAVESVQTTALRQQHHQVYDGGQASGFKVVELDNGGLVILSAHTSAAPAAGLVDVEWPAAQSESVVGATDIASNAWRRWSETAKSALEKSAPSAAGMPAAAAQWRVQRLAAVQATLGLSTLDMAQILNVTRQALYKWLDASKDVKLQEANRVRMACIERLATQWRERSSSPLSTLAREPLASGQSIIQLMSADEVNEAAVVAAFDELVGKLQAKPKSLSQKPAQAGFTRRPSARSLPPEE